LKYDVFLDIIEHHLIKKEIIMNFKLFNQIVQLLAFQELSNSGIKHGEVTPFAFSHDLEEGGGFYKTIFSRYFFGFKTEEEVEAAINAGVLVRTNEVYWIDPEDDDEEVVKLDIEIENGETIYAYNGYEVYPEDKEFIYKYKISDKIVEEAKDIYDSCEKFINSESNIFTFIENGIKYEVPLYAIVLLNAFFEDKNQKHLMIDLTKTDEEFKEVILKVKDISILIHASKSAKKIDTQDWRETIVFKE
jgi:hypothetical protein